MLAMLNEYVDGTIDPAICDEFEEHIKVVSRFVEVIDRHVPYLMRKAEIIEEYLQQR